MKRFLPWLGCLGVLLISTSLPARPPSPGAWYGGKAVVDVSRSRVAPTHPAAVAEPCYQFAYISTSTEGFEHIYEGGNCARDSTDLTPLINIPQMTFSHLSISPTFPMLAFLESHLDTGREYLDLFSVGSGGGLSELDGASQKFTPHYVAFNRGESIAIVSHEGNGSETIRYNSNASGHYPAIESNIIHNLGARGIAWIPTSDGSLSHRLVAAVPLSDGGATSYLFVLDDTGSLRIPLTDRSGQEIEGGHPAPDRQGQKLLFTKDMNGRDKIFVCDLDLSNPERAFCDSPIEVPQLRDLDGDFGSPCWSYDDAWIFYTFKPEGDRTHWDIYRDRYIGAPHQDQLTNSSDADEKEVACYPLILTAVSTAHEVVSTVPTQSQVYSQPATATVSVPLAEPSHCTKDSQCSKRQVCREGSCRDNGLLMR